MNGVAIEGQTISLSPFAAKSVDGFSYFFMPDSVMGEFQPSPDGSEYHESSIDYQVPFNCLVTGVKPILDGHEWGDYMYMKVIHPGSGTVLGQFGLKYRVSPESMNQDWIRPPLPYNAELMAGLIIRFFYGTKKLNNPIKAIVNIEVHQKVAANA